MKTKGLLKFGMWAFMAVFVMMPLTARAQKNVPLPPPAAGPDVDKGASEVARIEKELGITPEQSEKMRTMRQEFVAKQQALGNDLKVKKDELGAELNSDNLNRGKVDSLLADIKALQGKALDNRVDQVFLMREVLTTEQYKKFKDMRLNAQQGKGPLGEQLKPPMPDKVQDMNKDKKGKGKK
jgi:Spy/CpxP family protein refolding chaperone